MKKLYAFLLGAESIAFLIFMYFAALIARDFMPFNKGLYFQLIIWAGIIIVFGTLKSEVLREEK